MAFRVMGHPGSHSAPKHPGQRPKGCPTQSLFLKLISPGLQLVLECPSRVLWDCFLVQEPTTGLSRSVCVLGKRLLESSQASVVSPF